MNSLVSLQRIQPDKFLTAHATGVNRLLSVGPTMAPELRNGHKLSSAVGALGLNAGMNSTVEVQMLQSPKPAATNATRMRFVCVLATGAAFAAGLWRLRLAFGPCSLPVGTMNGLQMFIQQLRARKTLATTQTLMDLGLRSASRSMFQAVVVGKEVTHCGIHGIGQQRFCFVRDWRIVGSYFSVLRVRTVTSQRSAY